MMNAYEARELLENNEELKTIEKSIKESCMTGIDYIYYGNITNTNMKILKNLGYIIQDYIIKEANIHYVIKW